MRKLLIIIGSAKCGTSTVNVWLNKHPAFVAGAEKEPRHFTDFHRRSWTGPASEGFKASLIPHSEPDRYIANFPTLSDTQWAVDASTDYIWSEASPELIATAAETMDVRLLAIIRDPVARAISEYNHTLRSGWEDVSFGDSVRAESERVAQGYHPLFYHQRRSKVLDDIRRYKSVFGEKLMVMDYADLADPDAVIQRVCKFVDVEFQPIEPGENQNTSRLPRGKVAKFLLESENVKRVARVVPEPVRKSTWRALHTSSHNIQTVTDEETDMFRSMMADEIEACRLAPEIPTDNWKLAFKVPSTN